MNLHNQNRVYTEVNFKWCGLTNQYVEVSSVSEEYSGEWALCAAVTDQTDTDVGVGYSAGVTTAAAILQFNKANVTFPLITTEYAKRGTINVSFPEWSKLAGTTVTANAAGSEGDYQAMEVLTSAANTVEVLRHNVQAQVTDLVVHGTTEAAITQSGQVLGNAVAKKFDLMVCDLFDNFDNAVGQDDTLTWNILMDAVATLEANDAPRPYNAVLHPLQVYGSFGLSNEFSSIAAVNGSTGAFAGLGGGTMESQFMGAGFVTNIAGIGIHTSTSVLDGATGRKESGLFAKTAIGAGLVDAGGGSFIGVKTEREETSAATSIVANGYWAVTELVGTHGVEIDTEVS